ncbi:MAG: hypothetical protein WDA09_07865 [Bacteriovoracaceae bacterium]
MKKGLILLSLILLVVGVTLHFNSPSTETIVHETTSIQIKQTDKLQTQVPAQSKPQRTPASNHEHSKKARVPQLQIALSNIEFEYSLNENTHIVKNVSAIPKSKFKSSMGNVIFEDANFLYIQTSDGLSAGKLSVLDSKTKQLKPLSHIIKIPNVTEERRVQILAQGFKENVYLENLGLLFIETNTTDFSLVYEELRTEGYGPEYQILNRFYVPK